MAHFLPARVAATSGSGASPGPVVTRCTSPMMRAVKRWPSPIPNGRCQLLISMPHVSDSRNVSRAGDGLRPPRVAHSPLFQPEFLTPEVGLAFPMVPSGQVMGRLTPQTTTFGPKRNSTTSLSSPDERVFPTTGQAPCCSTSLRLTPPVTDSSQLVTPAGQGDVFNDQNSFGEWPCLQSHL